MMEIALYVTSGVVCALIGWFARGEHEKRDRL